MISFRSKPLESITFAWQAVVNLPFGQAVVRILQGKWQFEVVGNFNRNRWLI